MGDIGDALTGWDHRSRSAFMRVSPCLGAESAEASGVLAHRSFVTDANLSRHAHTSELPSPTVSVILHLCTIGPFPRTLFSGFSTLQQMDDEGEEGEHGMTEFPHESGLRWAMGVSIFAAR